MTYKFMHKYLSIVFLLASFMVTFHYHNDLKAHSDCQICTISASVTTIDTPNNVLYLTPLTILHEAILSTLPRFTSKHIDSYNNSRAPPAPILYS